MKRAVKILKVILCVVLILVLNIQMNVHARDDPEADKVEIYNHCEWDSVCIYAQDVSYTLSELKEMLTQGTLTEQILADAKGEVRMAPSYYLIEDGLDRVDITRVQEAVSEEGYAVLLYVRGFEKYYIRIKVFVTEDKEERQEVSPDRTQFSAPTVISEEGMETEIIETTPEKAAVKEKNELKRSRVHTQNRAGYNQHYLLIAGAVAIIGISSLKKEVYILRWYQRQLNKKGAGKDE